MMRSTRFSIDLHIFPHIVFHLDGNVCTSQASQASNFQQEVLESFANLAESCADDCKMSIRFVVCLPMLMKLYRNFTEVVEIS